jgi:hypothetical protein
MTVQSGSSALDRGSVIGLVDAVLVEINDEMIAAERRYIATVELALPAAPPEPGQQQLGNARGHLHHLKDASVAMTPAVLLQR